MDKTEEDVIKTAMLTEYTEMRAEILARIRGQGQSAAGAVALISGFIGVLSTIKLKGDVSIIYTLTKGDAEAIIVFALLCSGLVIGITILTLYWAYQVFMIFRIHSFLIELSAKYRDLIGEKENFILEWDRYSHGGNDLNLKNQNWIMRNSLQLIQKVQPLVFLITGILGLAGIYWGVLIDGGVFYVIFSLLAIGFVGTWIILLGVNVNTCRKKLSD